MDPNATLKEIRDLLDEWLSKGGFLPQDWNRKG